MERRARGGPSSVRGNEQLLDCRQTSLFRRVFSPMPTKDLCGMTQAQMIPAGLLVADLQKIAHLVWG